MASNAVLHTTRLGADLLELAVPEISDADSGRKIFKTAPKSVGRQTLRKQLGSGSGKRSASRFIPTKSAKQTSWSRRNVITNISLESCRVVFGTNLLSQFLEMLEGKSQQLTMSCRPTNKK